MASKTFSSLTNLAILGNNTLRIGLFQRKPRIEEGRFKDRQGNESGLRYWLGVKQLPHLIIWPVLKNVLFGVGEEVKVVAFWRRLCNCQNKKAYSSIMMGIKGLTFGRERVPS